MAFRVKRETRKMPRLPRLAHEAPVMQATLKKNSSHRQIHAEIGNKQIQTSSNVSQQHPVSPNMFVSQI